MSTGVVAVMAAKGLHPLMQVTLDTANKAIKIEGSLWDAFALWAGTEERAALNEKGLMRSVQEQIELYGAATKVDFDPNECSTYRVYRKLLSTARKFHVSVVTSHNERDEKTGEEKTFYSARSVKEVRDGVKAVRDAMAAGEKQQAEDAEQKEAGAEGDQKAVSFDDLSPLQQIEAAGKLTMQAFAKLQTIEERDEARKLIRMLALNTKSVELAEVAKA